MFPLDDKAIDWLWCSAVMILLAMVFDVLDGRVARLSHSSSDFGGQLDSLCDAISFGVAPAFLLLKLCGDPERFAADAVWIKGLWIIAVLYLMCVVMRLARFNVEKDDPAQSHLTFKGLPSPLAAGAIASVAILRNELRDPPLAQLFETLAIDVRQVEQILEIALPLGTVILSVLMVSRIPYPHLVNQILRGRRSFSHLVKLVFAVVTIVLLRQLALPIVCWSFVLSSPLAILWNAVRYRQAREEPLM